MIQSEGQYFGTWNSIQILRVVTEGRRKGKGRKHTRRQEVILFKQRSSIHNTRLISLASIDVSLQIHVKWLHELRLINNRILFLADYSLGWRDIGCWCAEQNDGVLWTAGKSLEE
mgnify:CR=1 FL=1